MRIFVIRKRNKRVRVRCGVRGCVSRWKSFSVLINKQKRAHYYYEKNVFLAQLGECATEDRTVPCSIHGEDIYFFSHFFQSSFIMFARLLSCCVATAQSQSVANFLFSQISECTCFIVFLLLNNEMCPFDPQSTPTSIATGLVCTVSRRREG